jgi:thiamine biosynthesis lipoprotein ApbE
MLLDDNDILFCNTCTLFGVLADNPTYSKQAQAELQKYIKRLVDVAKDKTGNMRKSSGILLAKIAKDESNRAIFTEHHGM